MHLKETEVIKKLKNYLPKKYLERDRINIENGINNFIQSTVANFLDVDRFNFSSEKKTLEDGIKINEFNITGIKQREHGLTIITTSYNKRKLESITYIDMQNKKNADNIQTLINYYYDRNVIEMKKTYGNNNFIIKNNIDDSFDVIIKRENELFKYNTLDNDSQTQKELYCLTHDFLFINQIENSIEEMKKIIEKPIEVKLNYLFDQKTGAFIAKTTNKKKLN